MVGGWFIGDFEPSLYKTTDFEVSVKYYKSGTHEKKHVHKISTEYTVIVSGVVRMNDVEYSTGDIIIIEPNESTDFKCITDVITTVVKTPSTKNDKYCL